MLQRRIPLLPETDVNPPHPVVTCSVFILPFPAPSGPVLVSSKECKEGLACHLAAKLPQALLFFVSSIFWFNHARKPRRGIKKDCVRGVAQPKAPAELTHQPKLFR